MFTLISSPGYCGSKFFAHVLGQIDGVTSLHEPGPLCRDDVPAALHVLATNPNAWLTWTGSDVPIWASLVERFRAAQGVHCETHSGLYLWIHLTARTLPDVRFIQLLRHPLDSCCTMLRAETDRDHAGRRIAKFGYKRPRYTHDSVPAQIAYAWAWMSKMITQQMAAIADSQSRCRTVEIELFRENTSYMCDAMRFATGQTKSIHIPSVLGNPLVANSHRPWRTDLNPTPTEKDEMWAILNEQNATYGYVWKDT